MAYIYHILPSSVIDFQRSEETYRHPSLATEGFIHCSTQLQLQATANRYFRDQPRLRILCIDEEKIQAVVKYESAGHGEFPHIYGPLNLDAIVAIREVDRSEDGSFSISDLMPET